MSDTTNVRYTLVCRRVTDALVTMELDLRT